MPRKVHTSEVRVCCQLATLLISIETSWPEIQQILQRIVVIWKDVFEWTLNPSKYRIESREERSLECPLPCRLTPLRRGCQTVQFVILLLLLLLLLLIIAITTQCKGGKQHTHNRRMGHLHTCHLPLAHVPATPTQLRLPHTFIPPTQMPRLLNYPAYIQATPTPLSYLHTSHTYSIVQCTCRPRLPTGRAYTIVCLHTSHAYSIVPRTYAGHAYPHTYPEAVPTPLSAYTLATPTH